MEQTVYVDLFFLINFSMDFLCFFLTSRLLSYRFSVKRTLLAAAVGGIYACVALFWGLSGLWSLLADLAACGAISAVAVFRRGNGREVAGYAVVYAACSIVLGGFMTVLFSLFNRLGLDGMLGEEGDGDGISVWLFALLALISGALSMFGMKLFKRKSTRQRGRVEIMYGDRRIILDALCDSGNLLTDPISAKPCIVAEKEEVKKILPQGVAAVIDNGRLDMLSKRDVGRVRVIPAQTVSGGGILYALKVDRVRLDMGKGWCDADALIALCRLERNADGAKALVPSTLAFGAP